MSRPRLSLIRTRARMNCVYRLDRKKSKSFADHMQPHPHGPNAATSSTASAPERNPGPSSALMQTIDLDRALANVNSELLKVPVGLHVPPTPFADLTPTTSRADSHLVTPLGQREEQVVIADPSVGDTIGDPAAAVAPYRTQLDYLDESRDDARTAFKHRFDSDLVGTANAHVPDEWDAQVAPQVESPVAFSAGLYHEDNALASHADYARQRALRAALDPKNPKWYRSPGPAEQMAAIIQAVTTHLSGVWQTPIDALVLIQSACLLPLAEAAFTIFWALVERLWPTNGSRETWSGLSTHWGDYPQCDPTSPGWKGLQSVDEPEDPGPIGGERGGSHSNSMPSRTKPAGCPK